MRACFPSLAHLGVRGKLSQELLVQQQFGRIYPETRGPVCLLPHSSCPLVIPKHDLKTKDAMDHQQLFPTSCTCLGQQRSHEAPCQYPAQHPCTSLSQASPSPLDCTPSLGRGLAGAGGLPQCHRAVPANFIDFVPLKETTVINSFSRGHGEVFGSVCLTSPGAAASPAEHLDFLHAVCYRQSLC